MLGERKCSENPVTKNLNIIIYSYKNPQLREVVDAAFSATNSFSPHVIVIDQHPLHRQEKMPNEEAFTYEHVFWDKIKSPCIYKRSFAFSDGTNVPQAEYTLILSDDFVLPEGWDTEVKSFLEEHPTVIVSGFGSGKVSIKEKYYLSKELVESDSFTKTDYIDSKFLIAKTSVLKQIDYPALEAKYHGESELLSLWAYEKKVTVFSAPTTIMPKDLGQRPLENLYTPFSIEHNYNSAIDALKQRMPEFFDNNGINQSDLKKVPYQVDDVLYDPFKLEMTEITQERFIASTKAIY